MSYKFLFCFVVCVLSVNPTKVFAMEDGKPAKLQFIDKRIIDYGDVKEGDDVMIDVRFNIIGEEDLVIYETSKTSNCTDTKLSSRIIQPGEEGFASIKISSKGKYGPQTIVVTLKTNGENDYYIIRINLNVLLT